MIRYRFFEIWRFLAALLIMLYHFSHFAPPETQWVKDDLERLRPLLDLFFIISGFLIFTRYEREVKDVATYLTYLGKRLARLYPLHLFTLAYFVLVGLAVQVGWSNTGGNPDLFDWSALPTQLLLVHAWGFEDRLSFNFVSWSLSAEWFAYLMLPVILIAYRRAGLGGLGLLVLLSFAFLEALVASGVTPFRRWIDIDSWGAYRVFADFALGAFISVLAARSRLRIVSTLYPWIAVMATCVSMLIGMTVYVNIALIALAIFLAAVTEKNRPAVCAYPLFLRPAAIVSFGVYLWHPVVESLMFSLIWSRYLEGHSSGIFFGYVAVSMLITIIIAMLSFRFLENPVAGYFLSRLGGSRKNDRVPQG
ncbi:acyltransferase family protein [Limoniibacter endophyticus]|uniref:Acyltransferase n=1 Tax=Limoniibacter endophyticus TaxID=1565040 RepID=A0A8J3DL89_9HYPH|nr:acyltransferase [Limoniibacter endophyticus]GHC66968.1 acyltransferase [Limoniibacter endophyticus]